MNMRKRGLLLIGGPLFLVALLALAPGWFLGKALGQEEPQRVEFYALAVVCEKNVESAQDSLGAPDGLSAEILPGGQLVVRMEGVLFPFPGIGGPEEGVWIPDSGSVVGSGGADAGLAGWFALVNEEGKQQHGWMRLGLSTTGFWLPPIGSIPLCDTGAGTDMIKISNTGTESLFVDAVIGYVREPEGREENQGDPRGRAGIPARGWREDVGIEPTQDLRQAPNWI
jgi:hypothetical protein